MYYHTELVRNYEMRDKSEVQNWPQERLCWKKVSSTIRLDKNSFLMNELDNTNFAQLLVKTYFTTLASTYVRTSTQNWTYND